MVSVTQRIKQYNSEVGQPRGGLVKPSAMTASALDYNGIPDVDETDDLGPIDARDENLHAGIVGTAVDYLSRLSRVQTTPEEYDATLRDVFRVSLRGAQRIDVAFPGVGVAEAAEEALAAIKPSEFEDGTFGPWLPPDEDGIVRAVCQLASYDVGARNDPSLWNAEYGPNGKQPDDVTCSHIWMMVLRAHKFELEYGPVTKDGFVFADPLRFVLGDRGGYTDLVDSGDGDFLTADTLWDMKVSSAKPTKDHVLQVLMYFLMGKESGLPEFEPLTHVGILNPPLGTVHRLAIADVPAETIETIRRDVIGYNEAEVA